jgi:hypothetical protein
MRRRQNVQRTGEGIPFGNGERMHIAWIEGPAAGYALYLLCPCMEGTGERGGEGKMVR